MKSYRKDLWFEVPTRRAFINITSDVQQCIDESGVKDGLVLVNTKHIWLTMVIIRIHYYLDWLEVIRKGISDSSKKIRIYPGCNCL
jgi:thiamine phosphate synthase YjbQ (UPF0047 family)